MNRRVLQPKKPSLHHSCVKLSLFEASLKETQSESRFSQTSTLRTVKLHIWQEFSREQAESSNADEFDATFALVGFDPSNNSGYCVRSIEQIREGDLLLLTSLESIERLLDLNSDTVGSQQPQFAGHAFNEGAVPLVNCRRL